VKISRSSALVVLIAVLAAGALSGAGIAVKRLTAPPAQLTATVHAPVVVTLAAPPAPPISLPAAGSLALAQFGGPLLAQRDAGRVRPTGSVAKTMTALVTLHVHPLVPGAPGPVLTMTEADVSLYRQAIAEQGSAVAVEAGERLTERQLLLALLLPSANNIAETLARWVAGSDGAFDDMLNATARSLDMPDTQFADPSGYSPETVSTAADLVRLGEAALANPALADLVSTRSATLPDGTQLQNLDILLGTAGPHWLGIKTGWTPQAGGCLLFAAVQAVGAGGLPVTLVGAVLGQPAVAGIAPGHPELGGAFQAAKQAATTAFAGYATVDLTSVLTGVTGSVTAPWGAHTGLLAQHLSRIALVRGSLTLQLAVSTVHLAAPIAAGTTAAVVSASAAAVPSITWRLVTTMPVPGPSWTWRLFGS